MHRRNAQSALTYTPQDILLFKDSPFASWMERLSVDNPNHGIEPDRDHDESYGEPVVAHPSSSPDVKSETTNVESVAWIDFIHNKAPAAPLACTRRYDSESLRQSDVGDVVVFDQCADESLDCTETLAAMHSGAQFVVNAQLFQAPLSCKVDMLIRSSGNSTLGDYCYLPCATKADTAENSALGLSFSADILQDIQGKLPPQMLVIPPGGQMVSLNTQDHIYHYRAIKERFLEAQGTFKKHRIPNPEESSNFGRWSQCANAILKRRALAKEIPDEAKVETMPVYAQSDLAQKKARKKARVYVDSDLPEKNYTAINPRLKAAGGADY